MSTVNKVYYVAPSAYAVVDHEGNIAHTVTVSKQQPEQSADWAQDQCHQHINESVESGVEGAGQWVVRPLIIAAPESRVATFPYDWLPDGDGPIPMAITTAGLIRAADFSNDIDACELDEVFKAMLKAASEIRMKAEVTEPELTEREEGIWADGYNFSKDEDREQCTGCLLEFDRGANFAFAAVRAKIFDCNSLAELELVLEKAVSKARLEGEVVKLPND